MVATHFGMSWRTEDQQGIVCRHAWHDTSGRSDSGVDQIVAVPFSTRRVGCCLAAQSQHSTGGRGLFNTRHCVDTKTASGMSQMMRKSLLVVLLGIVNYSKRASAAMSAG